MRACTIRVLIGVFVAAGITAVPAFAHEGPPFEILSNEQIGPYRVSVWSDPDIGTATFFVVLEPLSDAEYTTPDSVVVYVRPVSGRLAEVGHRAESQRVRYGGRYYAEAYLDQGEMWRVRVAVAGGGAVGEVLTEVEATPDGTIGPIGLVLYLLPFLAIGFLWLKAHLRRRARAADVAEHASHHGGR
ncbi:MAG TPA: hypothetical protein VF190_12470 [Rhodothermales bacterium]